MGKIRRGGYIFITWIGDHDPRHVHIFKDEKEIVKVSLPDCRVVSGRMTRRLRRILEELIAEESL